MSKAQEPFFYTELECPVCKTVNKFENIRNGAYTESGRDRDFKPTGRTWVDPAYQKFDPLLFFMATCQKCFYTREFNNEFKNWQKDSSFKTYRQKNIQQKHLSDLADKNGIILFLGSKLDQSTFPFETAVIKLLLGIYDAKFSGRKVNLDIGRYFLRIAWLFRDRNGGTGSQISQNARLFQELKGAAQVANQLVPNYDAKVSSIKNMINKDFSSAFSDTPEAEEHKKQIEEVIANMSASIGPLAEAGSKLIDLFKNAEKSLTGQEAVDEDKFFDYPGFTTFLETAKGKWDEVPVNEAEAMQKAAEYYQKAYETGGEISQGIQQVQAAYLIAELYRRVGQRDEAGQYFNQTIKMGRDIVMGKKGDASTVNYTKNLLEMAMEQARLNKSEAGGEAK